MTKLLHSTCFFLLVLGLSTALANRDALNAAPPFPIHDKDPKAGIELYRLDTLSHELLALSEKEALAHSAELMGFDPVRFTLRANKDSIALGEEIELTIRAEFLGINPNLIFTFAGSNAYTLKLLMPQGFVQTGGSYYDYIQGKVDRQNPVKEYTLKGYFEGFGDGYFQLLRGFQKERKVFVRVAKYRTNIKSKIFGFAQEPKSYDLEFLYRKENSGLNNGESELLQRSREATDDDCVIMAVKEDLNNSQSGSNVSPAGWEIIKTIDVFGIGDAFPYGNNLFNDFINTIPTSNDNGKVAGFFYSLSGSYSHMEGIFKNVFFDDNTNYYISFEQAQVAKKFDNNNGFFEITIDGVGTFNSTQMSGFNEGFARWTSPKFRVVHGGNKRVTIRIKAQFPNNNQNLYLLLDDFQVYKYKTAQIPTISTDTYDAMTLHASGCVGDIIWSTGNLGRTLHAKPGTYSAKCRVDGCEGAESNRITIGWPTINANTTSICPGETATLSASHCTNARFQYWSGFDWELFSSPNAAGVGQYRVLCNEAPSNMIEIRPAATPPIAPKIYTNIEYVCDEATAKLEVERGSCSGLVLWSNGQKGDSIQVQSSGIYTAKCEITCGTGHTYSPNSNSVSISYSEVCACDAATLSSNAPSGSIGEGSQLKLTATAIPGVSYTWTTPNGTSSETTNELTINNVQEIHEGNYSVTLSCGATVGPTWVNVDPVVVNCEGQIQGYGGSNSPDGEVGVDGTLQFTADGGDSYLWWGPNGWWSNERNPRIENVNTGHSGTYQVKITKDVNGTECSQIENVPVKIDGCNLDVHAYFYESGQNFVLNVDGNIDWGNASVTWWKGSTAYDGRSVTLPKTDQNRGTYYAIVTKGQCQVEVPIYIDYVATPVYESYINAVACERIFAQVLDGANAHKSLSFSVRVKIDEDVYDIPTSQKGDGSPAIVYFNVPKKYKDGKVHQVTVYDPYSQPIQNSAEKSFTCCTLEFAEQPLVSGCDPETAESSVKVQVNDGFSRTYAYTVSQMDYNQDGEVKWTDIAEKTLTSSSKENTFTGLKEGNYQVTVTDTHPDGGCKVSTVVPIYCGDAGDENCQGPILTVSPTGEIREGEGVIPTIHADVPAINPANNKEGLILDGNSSLNIGNRTFLYGNLTVDALVNPDPDKTISLGDISESATQHYLYKSWNGGISEKVGAQLSVGANGVNLIETGNDGYRRLVLSYATKLTGWNHIAVTYENNKARLLINGVLVKSSDTTPPFGHSVVGPNTIGDDLNRGFTGSMYSFRIWNKALSDNKVGSIKNNFSESLAIEPNIGFWKFDKKPEGGVIKDLSAHQRNAKVEGLAHVLLPSEPINSPTAPQVTWWRNDVQVGSGKSYTVPESQVRAGTLTYTAQYQKADGTHCSTDVDIVVNPIDFGTLSGCYFMKSASNGHSMTPYRDENWNGPYFNVADYSPTFEKKILEFSHLGDEVYRISSPFYEGMAIDYNSYNTLILNNIRHSSESQKWKAVPVSTAAGTYRFESKANPGSFIVRGSTSESQMHLGGGSPSGYNTFEMVSTACPLPPSPCDVNNQITFERFLQPALAGYGYNEFQNLDVKTFIAHNEGYPPIYIHTGDIGSVSINRSVFDQMDSPKPTPANIGWTSLDNRWVGRLSGYFCPPKNGDYVFYIKSDEWAEINMSTDEDPAHKTRIAHNENYAADYNTHYTQKSYPIAMTKGRMYYFEVLFKDWANTLFVDVATRHIQSGEVVPLKLENISSHARDLPPNTFTITPNKNKVAPTEEVTISSNGCYYGRVVWRAGANIIEDPYNSIPTITETGPGVYQAICVGDPSVIQDWVTVTIEPINEIVPIPSGPATACDGQSVLLQGTGAPTGFTYKWYLVKPEYADAFRENRASFNLFEESPEMFDTFTTADITVTGPGEYFLQAISQNGWKSQVRSLKVQPTFPAGFAPQNNGPVEIGGTLTLSAPNVQGATYQWTGPNGFSQNGHMLQRAGFADEMAGTYTLSVTLGTCSHTGTTEVDVADCDLYIKATNAEGEDTYELERQDGQTGPLYEPLNLKILPYTGNRSFANYDIRWLYNGNPLEEVPNSAAIQVDRPGRYTATLTSRLDPANSCQVELHIKGRPCHTFEGSGTCGPLSLPPIDDYEGVALAAGDEFTAADYTVVVTEVTSGSSAGWWGKGYVAMRLPANITASKISVTFEDAVVNDCYELVSGRVLTEYDPNWKGVADVDEVVAGVLSLVSNVKDEIIRLTDLINTFNCETSQSQEISELLSSISDSKAGIMELGDLNDEEKELLANDLASLADNVHCMQEGCSAQNGRFRSEASSCSVGTFNSLSEQFSSNFDRIIPVPNMEHPLGVDVMQTRSKRFNKVRIKIRTYLPFNYVYEPPVDFSWDAVWPNPYVPDFNNMKVIDLANVRDYPQYAEIEKHGGYKTKQEIVFNFGSGQVQYGSKSNGNLIVPVTHTRNLLTGEVKEYTNESTAENSENIGLISSNVLKTLKFNAKISSGNPAVTPAPHIDYSLSVSLREDGYYFIEGVWDGFPAIEVFVEDMETGKVDLIYEKKPTYTRGKQGNEYTGGQIFKLIDVIGDERFTIGNFLGYKPHTDKSVSPYLKDIEKMKVLFDLNKGFDGD